MEIFSSADLLLPEGVEMEKWAVIACDQFTAQPEYWHEAEQLVGEAPSTLRLILPEAELGLDEDAHIRRIHETMLRYLRDGVLRAYPNAFVYVERGLRDGRIRRGLVGKLDLEQYDYDAGSAAPVRATEKTVVERIPPRMRVREHATLELPHVLLLCDDEDERLIEPMRLQKAALPKLYDFTLMAGGGPVAGWLVEGLTARKLRERIAQYERSTEERFAHMGLPPLLYAVGDGNHSLATAKACWEQLKPGLSEAERETNPARFALVELENLHDEAQQFTPIHRLVRHTDVKALLNAARETICAEGGEPLPWVAGAERGTLPLALPEGALPIGVLQGFLDAYLATHTGELDYIHEEDALCALAAEEGAVGFLLPAMEKGRLFPGLMAGGALPRKTFSMGHAAEKRYYLEARRITNE